MHSSSVRTTTCCLVQHRICARRRRVAQLIKSLRESAKKRLDAKGPAREFGKSEFHGSSNCLCARARTQPSVQCLIGYSLDQRRNIREGRRNIDRVTRTYSHTHVRRCSRAQTDFLDYSQPNSAIKEERSESSRALPPPVACERRVSIARQAAAWRAKVHT